MVCAYVPSTWETEARELWWVQGQFGYINEFQDFLNKNK